MRKLAVVITALAIAASAQAAPHAASLLAATNLRADAAQAKREHKPIVILFSLPGCPYCQVIRQNYLLPLLHDLPAKKRPIVREIDMTSAKKVIGIDGAATTQSAVAKNLHVRVAPTLMFLDGAGEQLSAPIIGGDTAGFYNAYLDRALAEAEQKLSDTASAQKKTP